MAAAISNVRFSSIGPEQPIMAGDPDPTKPQKIFTMGLTAGAGGLPIPYFKSRPSGSYQSNDGPCDIRIMDEGMCLIVFNLDPGDYDCEFRYPSAITLGPNDEQPGPADRYTKLRVQPNEQGKYLSLSFNATKLPASTGINLDPYNIYLHLWTHDSNGQRIRPPITIRYDPDIKNPGEYGFIGG